MSFALIAMSHQAGEGVLAVKPDDPLTWVVEYPVVIAPFVEDYSRCFGFREIRMGEGKRFEVEHARAAMECEPVRVRSVARAKAALAKRNKIGMTPSDVNTLFDNIRVIHVARGKDLDDQMAMGLTESPYTQQVSEDGTMQAKEEIVGDSAQTIDGATSASDR